MKEKFLRELADIQTGPFGSQLHKEDYVADGTPIVTVEHLGNKMFSEQNLPRVSNTDKNRLKKYVLKQGDIVFSRVGSVDRCSYVDQKHVSLLLLLLRGNKAICPKYSRWSNNAFNQYQVTWRSCSDFSGTGTAEKDFWNFICNR